MIEAIKYQPAVADTKWKKFPVNSIDYRQFWDQEIERCVKGYKPTNGTWIPGNYYFYINYCTIERLNEDQTRKTDMIPAYRDQDHEYFVEVDNAQKGGYGLIVGKARRKGFSFNNMGIALAEISLNAGTVIGVGSEVDDYVADFRDRTIKAYFALPTALRSRYLHKNDDKFMLGYKEKDKQLGDFVEKGLKSMIHWRVMDPTGKKSAFRGLSLKYGFFEEFGEWKAGRKHLYSTEECFREGAIQFGIPIIGGTSNQISNDSPDYMKMFTFPDEYGLKSLFISAAKVYGGFFDFKTGTSDVKGADADIERRAAEKKKSEDRNAYNAFRQEMPTKPEHMFLQSSNTPFDLEKINAQIANLTILKKIKIAQNARLEWPEDPKTGKKIKFGQPTMSYDIKGNFIIAAPPIPAYANAHVGAMDPYHINDEFEEKNKTKTAESKRPSKGCCMVYRRFINPSEPGQFLVAEYTDRPDTKEEFYENCAKLAIYYDCQLLGEYNDAGFFEYFVKNGLVRYLKARPRAADAPYSDVSNKYGIHMKDYQKSLAIDKIGDYIKHYYEDIYFLDLLMELAKFGSKNTDRAMCFGMCLIHDMDNRNAVVDQEEENKKPKDFISYYTYDAHGNLIQVSANTQSFEN